MRMHRSLRTKKNLKSNGVWIEMNLLFRIKIIHWDVWSANNSPRRCKSLHLMMLTQKKTQPFNQYAYYDGDAIQRTHPFMRLPAHESSFGFHHYNLWTKLQHFNGMHSSWTISSFVSHYGASTTTTHSTFQWMETRANTKNTTACA